MKIQLNTALLPSNAIFLASIEESLLSYCNEAPFQKICYAGLQDVSRSMGNKVPVSST